MKQRSRSMYSVKDAQKSAATTFALAPATGALIASFYPDTDGAVLASRPAKKYHNRQIP
jgi:hypothetical protein